MIGILRGLEYAHKQDVLHRNLTPEKILLDSESIEPKIGGFCLSLAALENKADHADFMAPELSNSQHSTHSDIYAASVIFYELLTGKRPSLPYLPPSDIVQCHEQFDQVLAKALQSNPTQRYQSAAELAEELEPLLHLSLIHI